MFYRKVLHICFLRTMYLESAAADDMLSYERVSNYSKIWGKGFGSCEEFDDLL